MTGAALVGVLLAAVVHVPAHAFDQEPCFVPDNGTGTASLPATCSSCRNPGSGKFIENGLPPGDVIVASVNLTNFVVLSETPGGGLGGDEHTFTAELQVDMRGTGTLAGFARSVSIPISTGVLHSGPRALGTWPQEFKTDLFQLHGQIVGDPDFDLLRITAGTDFGMPSPGHCRLDRREDGRWAVDSYFDITYRVDFVGAPGGSLAGMSGSTTTQQPLFQGAPIGHPCSEPDNGLGYVAFPVACQPGYESPPSAMVVVDGLPTGSPVVGRLTLHRFTPFATFPGGIYGGEVQQWDGFCRVQLDGTANYDGYARDFMVSVTGETHLAPPAAGLLVQDLACDMVRMQGQIVGDPDFDLLRITAGTAFGMPSPGHTTLSRIPDGRWSVDSFFDITYRIDFVGAPGGTFPGLSGSTLASGRFQAGSNRDLYCEVPDIGSTAQFPPACGTGYVSPADAVVSNGLFPSVGADLEGTLMLGAFAGVTEVPGGPLGGDVQTWSGVCGMQLVGHGPLSGYRRFVTLPINGLSFSGPRPPGAVAQRFDAQLNQLSGQIAGDPDFDLLRITAGDGFGMPSPGRTTFTQLPGGNWAVDSFFDITYRIDFVGAPGGPLAGLSNSTTSSDRFEMGVGRQTLDVPAKRTRLRVGSVAPNPARARALLAFDLPEDAHVRASVYDVAGRLVDPLVDREYASGQHTLSWDGLDRAGQRVAPGLYFYRVNIGGEAFRRTVVFTH